jgi:2-polyprenyl-3-methyl-5-hydroxy-6-metoxy-1,4-benzoquinol methylase
MDSLLLNLGSETETIKRCIICADSNTVVDNRYQKLLGLISPYGIKKCSDCGLRWVSPRPTEKGYSELYKFETYFEGNQAVESYSALAKERRNYFIKRLSRIEKIVATPSSLKILDIGAATGEFVHEAAKRGHYAIGFEISEGAREKAKRQYDIDLIGGNIWDLAEIASFDVIHMNHVLEHFPNPKKELSSSYKLLKKGGLLVVEVPQQFNNDLDRIRRFLQIHKRPAFNNYSFHHTYFFSPATLARFLGKHNFSLISLNTANPDLTPLKPFKWKNLFLRVFLETADKVHKGGNIIEAYARKS